MFDQINKLLRTRHALTQRLDRDPSLQELADDMGLHPKKVESMLKVVQHPLSLEMPTYDGDATLADLIEDSESPDPAENAVANLLSAHIGNVLAGLPPREATVLKLRYGLQDGQTHTLAEVGTKMGITRERVRQIEAQALRRLRDPAIQHKLQTFL